MGIGAINGTGSNTSSTKSGSQTMDACLKNMTQTAETAAQKLYASGQPTLAKQVENQAIYAEAMAKINNAVVSNMTEAPGDRALIQSATAAALVVGTGAGALVGSGGGGFVVGSLLASGLQASDAATEAHQAQVAIDQINFDVNTELANITDENIENQLISAASATTKALGGTFKVGPGRQAKGRRYSVRTLLFNASRKQSTPMTKKTTTAIVVILIIAALGAGAYWYFMVRPFQFTETTVTP